MRKPRYAQHPHNNDAEYVDPKKQAAQRQEPHTFQKLFTLATIKNNNS